MPFFSGSFSSISLPDVLQLVRLAGMSGTLLVITEQRLARLYFRRGALADAGISGRAGSGAAPSELRAFTPGFADMAWQAERLKKMAAVISRLPGGHFNFITSAEPDTLSDLALDVEAVLLDVLRAEDEAGRGQAAA